MLPGAFWFLSAYRHASTTMVSGQCTKYAHELIAVYFVSRSDDTYVVVSASRVQHCWCYNSWSGCNCGMYFALKCKCCTTRQRVTGDVRNRVSVHWNESWECCSDRVKREPQTIPARTKKVILFDIVTTPAQMTLLDPRSHACVDRYELSGRPSVAWVKYLLEIYLMVRLFDWWGSRI